MPPRLLVVDDDPVVASIFGRVGRAVGYDVMVTDEPADVRARVQMWAPDVILLDLVMPGIDGVEVLRLLSADGCRARIVVASAMDRKTIDYARALGLGHRLDMAGVLRKPCAVEEVEAMLRAVQAGGPAHAITPAAIDRALAGGEIFLHYQPKLDLRSGRILGVEALLRWQHPQRGRLAPALFVPLIEQAGLLARVSEHVLLTAMRQQAAWQRAGLALEVSVNLSARDFVELDVAGVIGAELARAPGPRAGLILEITEGAAVADFSRIALVPELLEGVRLSIDDFGIGYSSLVGLRRLPISEVKIDRSFVTGCETSREDCAIVRSIVGLAHELGMKTVAEGVETAQTAVAVRALGCDVAQGFHYAAPLPAAGLSAWAAAWQAAAPNAAAGPAPAR